jgi:hypothetical protein
MESNFKLIGFLVFILFLLIFGLVFITPFKTQRVISEVLKLNPTENTLNLIKSQKCSQLSKEEKFWIVNGCEKKDIYFKLFLQDSGYYLGYCTSFNTPREAFLKLKEFFGLECPDLGKEDVEIISEGLKKIGLKAYNLCGGRKVLFKGECIVGVK